MFQVQVVREHSCTWHSHCSVYRSPLSPHSFRNLLLALMLLMVRVCRCPFFFGFGFLLGTIWLLLWVYGSMAWLRILLNGFHVFPAGWHLSWRTGPPPSSVSASQHSFPAEVCVLCFLSYFCSVSCSPNITSFDLAFQSHC